MSACGQGTLLVAAPFHSTQLRNALSLRCSLGTFLPPLRLLRSARLCQDSSSRRNTPQIRSAATTSSLSVPALDSTGASDNLHAFWQWLAENGAVDAAKASIRISEGQEGLSLVAARNIYSGEDVFNVPDSLILSLQAIPASSPLASFTPKLKPWVALALFLLLERANPQSKWKPYLNILPTTLQSPIYWSEEELNELKGTQLLPSVESYRAYLASSHASALLLLGDEIDTSLLTLDAFSWAFGILRSRAFPPLIGEEIALVPLADMINHGKLPEPAPGKTLWERRQGGLFGGQKGVAMRAGRSYKSGEQVVMNYGTEKSNADLALDFGFAERQLAPGEATSLTRRSRETFVLTLEIASDDRFHDDKADVAELNGLTTSEAFVVVSGDGPPDRMLPYLRLSALGGEDAFLLEALFRSSVWGHLEMALSRDNEEAVCAAMVEGCQVALGGYATSMEQDLRLLRETSLPPRLETAAIVRLGEKRVLTELLDFFESRLEGLDNLEYYAERRLRDLGLLDENSNMTPWVFNE